MIENQAYLFGIFVINGILIGLLFDFFRILRKSFKTNDFITYVEDIVFWILTGIILLYSIFLFNNGEIRLFMLIAVLLGLIIYMLSISRYIIKVNVKIINFFKTIILKIISIILIPFKYIVKIFRKIFFRPVSFIIINVKKFSTNYLKKFSNKLKNNKKSVKIWK